MRSVCLRPSLRGILGSHNRAPAACGTDVAARSAAGGTAEELARESGHGAVLRKMQEMKDKVKEL